MRNTIDDQELSIKLNQLRSAFDTQEKTGSDVDKLLLTSQSRTVSNAESFFPAVKKKQEQGFNQEKKCQNSPWDEVVPLFIQGMQNAKEAKNIFLHDISKRKSAMAAQQKALKAWKDALAILLNKKKSESKENQQNQPQENEQKNQQPKESEPQPMQAPGGTNLNNVLQMLQEMENDDRSKPKILETPANKEVDRPW